MRWTLTLVLAAGCGSVEPIGPPESSGDTWGTSGGAPDLSSTSGSDTDAAESSSGGSSGTSSGTSTGTSTGQVDGSSSGDCPLGESGCACLADKECVNGFTCTTDICVPDLPCPVEEAGMETCQCTDGGGCDEGLTCASNLCVDAG